MAVLVASTVADVIVSVVVVVGLGALFAGDVLLVRDFGRRMSRRRKRDQ
jgi:hypothetical protein